MQQLNIRVPSRLFEEFDVCCQMHGKSKKETTLALLAAFVNICRRNNNLPQLSFEELMEDIPKPKEGTL
jgi:hypothetical protein